MPTQRVSVVGLGKLGLCLAAVLAKRGFGVTGVDVDQDRVDAVNEARSPIYEPGLESIIKSNSNRLSATIDYDKGLAGTDVTFVIVPTPSNKAGAFSLRFVKPAMENIGKAIAAKGSYHLVVLTSTVMPGSIDGVVKPLLEKSAQKNCGEQMGLCYNPEFIALGDVITGLLKPDFILIGESDFRAGETLSRIQRQLCMNAPPMARMNFVSAELAKISVNSFVTTKMSFANTLAEICEKLPGADVDSVTSALGKDKRIGPAYLKGALGYGGPCFPRDNIAFARLADHVGAQAEIALATHQVNLRQVGRIVRLLQGEGLSRGTKVALLGLTYKPKTNVIEESQSIMLARRLVDEGLEVRVYDPAVSRDIKAVLGTSVQYGNSAKACIEESDVVILATPWKEFEALEPEDFTGKIVVDCWRILSGKTGLAKKYLPVGVGVYGSSSSSSHLVSILGDD